ncbi:hypothetical protein [Pelagibacterium luteolum]|uniref:Uncharacterized protein n=1 Tax=Pelagibacterium luteolum TaxID=440168 RepID=A0A1G7ZHT2_9HYPH|nr:hypothetical protein [Pelagibacterium luteolum]SDH08234.1 hypothetical protein SAMN04487974_12025 [Pelagibacterium luteolum]
MRLIRKLLRLEPAGYTLVREDGKRHNRIRGDLIPVGVSVIIDDGRYFVRTDTADHDGFEVYREGHSSHIYHSANS